jgi:hypothetical protein
MLAGCAGEATVGYAGPAPVYVAPAPVYAPPPMVEVDGSPGVEVVTDYDYPVFFSDGLYWRNDGGVWYSSRYHNAGWARNERVPMGVRHIDRPEVYAHYRGGPVEHRDEARHDEVRREDEHRADEHRADEHRADEHRDEVRRDDEHRNEPTRNEPVHNEPTHRDEAHANIEPAHTEPNHGTATAHPVSTPPPSHTTPAKNEKKHR